jgi:hypothetical protein
MASRYRAIWSLLSAINQWRGLHNRQGNDGVLVVCLRSADCAARGDARGGSTRRLGDFQVPTVLDPLLEFCSIVVLNFSVFGC